MIRTATPSIPRSADVLTQSTIDRLYSELDTEGLVVLPEILSPEQLLQMQTAFETRLQRPRWNNFDGYQQTETQRHMVEDVLLLDQGFLDIALHPLVTGILDRYLGSDYQLTEAKGWRSTPTTQDFHGWHGDAWYDQAHNPNEIPREVKLALYLTDVRSGAFNYLKRSHRKQHPRPVRNEEVAKIAGGNIVELANKAGTAFLFDTSGIHRQGVPMLEPRCAVFYNYHDPLVPLQEEDITYYRYHPLLLNAAFLGNLSGKDMRILGFGDKTNFIPAFQRRQAPSMLYSVFASAFKVQLQCNNLLVRTTARLRHLLGRDSTT